MTPGGERRARLTTAFCIGRNAQGDVEIDDQQMNHAHAAVFRRDGQWWLRDLGSTEGMLLDGARVQDAPLPRRAGLDIGAARMRVTLDVEEPASQRREVGAGLVEGRVRLERSAVLRAGGVGVAVEEERVAERREGADHQQPTGELVGDHHRRREHAPRQHLRRDQQDHRRERDRAHGGARAAERSRESTQAHAPTGP
jgi:pSer/pThr/pTyr-binding forkhead associated (FHA) protein